MEEDILEKIENIISYYAQSDDKEVYDGAMFFKKLLQAYKQDEKVIWEMAKELNNRDFGFDYGIADEDLYDGIIDYFRKKCE